VLRWFKKVAEGATVTEVSDLEGVTQSGVSRALARLEEQVGTPLLRRSGRRLRLTQAGEVFKPYVDALLHQLDDGVTAVSQFISPETGTVRLAFQQSLGVWLVPDLVRSFRASHPAVGFHLTQVTGQLPVGSLAGGGADLEISTRVFPAGHPEPVRTRRIGRLTEELCGRAGFRPRIVFEGDELSSVWGFVAAGLGVAVVPTPRASSPGGVIGPVRYLEIGDSGAERVINLSWPAGRPLLPAAELFREHVISQVRAGLVPAPLVTQNSS